MLLLHLRHCADSQHMAVMAQSPIDQLAVNEISGSKVSVDMFVQGSNVEYTESCWEAAFNKHRYSKRPHFPPESEPVSWI